MKLDHAEFIARHHKALKPDLTRSPAGPDYFGLTIFALVILFAIAFLFTAFYAEMHPVTRATAISAFLFVLLVGGLVYRAYFSYARYVGQLSLLREVLEGSRGARLITDSADNAVYVNRKLEALCKDAGAPSLESLQQLFQNNGDAVSHFKLLAEQAKRGLTDSVELLSQHKGQTRYLSVTAQPVSGHAGYVHWRVDDVTQKHKAERVIRQEREKLIDFTDNAPVGFFSVNEQGRFVFANATFARWLGEDLNFLLEQGYLHTYLSEPPQNTKPYDLTQESGPRQIAELTMKGPGGRSFLASINQIVVYEPNGKVRTRAVVHDLTAEREMRRALKASEDRFQRFFEEAPLGIIQADHQGRIVDCNAAFAAMMQKPVEAMEGKDFKNLLKGEGKESVLSAMARIEQGEEISAPLEVTFEPGKNKRVTAQMYARKFREGGNIVLHFIDMTEQKTLEAQFVQSQKMQAIGQLAGGIAHDFNNLLTAIIGFCDLLLLRHKPGDPSFGDIMQIKQNSNRAANLVRQLLAFSRQQTLRQRVHDVSDILTELSYLLRRLLGASVELELFHGDQLGLIKVDEGQMEQVLINLAVNARDAMNDVGKLTIETDNFSNKKTRELISEELPPGNWTLIRVIDTGCGIPKKNMTRIFEPFFTTKDVGQGTGLGLATVYGIIRQSGGYLDVESRVGKGTTFTIYLPHAEEGEEEDAPEERPEDSMQDLTGTERILLVEDEDAVRTFSQRALSNKGYEVLAADSGESALNLLENADDKHLDLLITDVVMPNMDGPTLAQRIRQNNKDLKIIFISGYTEDKLKDYMGPNTYFLPKPFTLKTLAAKVKDALQE